MKTLSFMMMRWFPKNAILKTSDFHGSLSTNQPTNQPVKQWVSVFEQLLYVQDGWILPMNEYFYLMNIYWLTSLYYKA